MMKSLQIVAHTTGGEVRSAAEDVTERDYEEVKNGLKDLMGSGLTQINFNTDNGWVIIPASQLLYVEVILD